MLKSLTVAAGFVLCLSSIAAAQAPKEKRAPTPAQNQVQTQTPAPCAPGTGKNADGSCLTPTQVAAAEATRVRADCMVQMRMNYNWCPAVLPSADLAYPKEAEWDTFAFTPFGLLSAPGATAKTSDIRLKRDIRQVGRLDNGIKLYSFRYLWSDRTYVGVMAQQVAVIVPEAVVMEPNGYLAVYYDRLGLKMQTLEEWQAGRTAATPAAHAAP